MRFTSSVYLLFLLVLVPLYWLLPRRGQNYLLLAASAFFYGFWDWRFLGLLAAIAIASYWFALRIGMSEEQSVRRKFLLGSVALNILALVFLKYFNFFSESFQALLRFFGLGIVESWTLEIVLPLGISFFTLQATGYVIDVYRKKIHPSSSLADVALFVMFFPTIVAGPIERAKNLLPQFEQKRLFDADRTLFGISLIAWGFFKKLVIADRLGHLVSAAYPGAGSTAGTSGEALIGIIAFGVQIYADFSGYTDIARGTARLFGIDLMENFRRPYLAKSFSEFWRRWHISLSSWMRDYVFFALPGSLSSHWKQVRNAFVTFVVSGLWHGASWTFVAWGALHGAFYGIEQLVQASLDKPDRQRSKSRRKALAPLRIALVLAGTFFAWSVFKAPTLGEAATLWAGIFAWSGWGSGLVGAMTVVVCAAMILSAYALEDAAAKGRIPRWGLYALLVVGPPVLAVVTWLFAVDTSPPFIYRLF